MQYLIKRLPVMVSFVMLGLAVLLKWDQVGFIEQFQNMVFDFYQQQLPREYEPAGVRIIDIDDDSLARLGQWPWPRSKMAQIVQKLIDMNAGVIAFDIVFAEPDRTSPANLSEIWGADASLKKQLEALPDHDSQLAQAFANGYIVTGYSMSNAKTAARPLVKFGSSFSGNPGEHPKDFVYNYRGATVNLPQLEQAAEGNGFFSTKRDSDGVIRRIPLLATLDEQVYYSLSMETLRVAQGASSYLVTMQGTGGSQNIGLEQGISHIRNGKFVIPTDNSGRFLIYQTRHADDRYIPAWQLLEPDFDASRVEGQILFFGTSAAGLQDLRATALYNELPGVELHVQALEQILLNKFLYRPGYLLYLEVVGMVVMGLLLMLIMARLTAVWGAVFMLVAQGGSLGFSFYMFHRSGFLIDPVSPSLVILLLYLSESLRRYILSESERKQVRGAFAQYMSPVLVEELAKHPEKLTLGGEMKELTVLFCDIRGFTTISERFNAQELTAFINRFLTPMTDVILQHKGTIDKYMGDCIMAFWGAPLDDLQHARNGCISALRMFEALDALNEERRVRSLEEGWDFFAVQIGVGLNTGDICVGNMGSQQRFDYSVLGDDVNLASRLEGQSKTYGVNIVIGQNTQEKIPDMATIELDLIKVKGKTEAVTIYALLGDETLADEAPFIKLKELWNKALKSYRAQGWDEAENFIGLCRTQMEKQGKVKIDGLFELYLQRIATYRITPPAPDWDGVFEATSK